MSSPEATRRGPIPIEQRDEKGFYALYRVPVYRILVQGADRKLAKSFAAPRFMPFYNDPKAPDPDYPATGWVNAGLSSARRVIVAKYKQDYRVRNRFSPGIGAIVVKDAFFIHAGQLEDVGFGSAGCIEIVGDYNDFKGAIASLGGTTTTSADAAIQQLVRAQRLVVTIQQASVPDIKKSFTRRIADK